MVLFLPGFVGAWSEALVALEDAVLVVALYTFSRLSWMSILSVIVLEAKGCALRVGGKRADPLLIVSLS